MVESWRERLNRLLSENSLNMKEVSLRAGRGETYVRDILKRDRDPSADNLAAVEQAIGDILGERQGLGRANVRIAPISLPPRDVLPKDVPVMGTAAGSALSRGAFLMSTEPVDYVLRPPGLLAARGIYALYVEGDSMSPKFEPGDLVYVNEFRPVSIGDAVVIQEPTSDEDYRGYIKVLTRRTAEWVETKQFNPPANVKFKNSPGIRIHKVMTWADLFGV